MTGQFKFIVCEYIRSKDYNGRELNFYKEITGFSPDAEAPAKAYYGHLTKLTESHCRSTVFILSTSDIADPKFDKDSLHSLFERAKPFKIEQCYE